jgi:hypothetical protein
MIRRRTLATAALGALLLGSFTALGAAHQSAESRDGIYPLEQISLSINYSIIQAWPKKYTGFGW